MDKTGEQQRRSLCDDIGARLDCSTGLKLLCGLWLAPGIALTWFGFGSMGIRASDGGIPLGSLEKVQAASIMLCIFSVVVAAMWAIRVGDEVPSYRSALRPRSTEAKLANASLAGIAVVTLIIAQTTAEAGPWFTIAAWAGFFTVVGMLRPLAAAPVARPQTLMAFAAACAFQVTVGWLHLLDPSGPFAVTTVAQGLILVWTATAAVREIGATQRVVRFGRATDAVSREQAPLPLAEPAVGH